MSILSDLSTDFLQFLDKHNLYLKVSELYNCKRSEWGILRKNTDGPYLLKIIHYEDGDDEDNKIIVKWDWVNCHWLELDWLKPKESSKTEVKEIGCTLLILLLYFSYVYAGQNVKIVFSKKNSELFKKKKYIEAQQVNQYYYGKPYCFLCQERTNNNVCNICNINSLTFFDIPHYRQELLLTYQHLYNVLLQKRKTIFSIKFVKDYMNIHHYKCYVKEQNKNNIEGYIGLSAENIMYFIEYDCKQDSIIINIADCISMTEPIKIIVLHLMSAFSRQHIEVQYKENSVLCTRDKPPSDSVLFFNTIGFEYNKDNNKWNANYSQIEHHIERLGKYYI